MGEVCSTSVIPPCAPEAEGGCLLNITVFSGHVQMKVAEGKHPDPVDVRGTKVMFTLPSHVTVGTPHQNEQSPWSPNAVHYLTHPCPQDMKMPQSSGLRKVSGVNSFVIQC